ncbi:hypothetical protein SUGI_0239800 [Cryptomeria japonica]|nr:hypothetical protein SUGI_0239800 [Cryptomeria japonica]
MLQIYQSLTPQRAPTMNNLSGQSRPDVCQVSRPVQRRTRMTGAERGQAPCIELTISTGGGSQHYHCAMGFITNRNINCNVFPLYPVAQGRYQTLYVTSFIHNYRQELARYPALTTGTQQCIAIYNTVAPPIVLILSDHRDSSSHRALVTLKIDRQN